MMKFDEEKLIIIDYNYHGHNIMIKVVNDDIGKETFSFIDDRIFRAYDSNSEHTMAYAEIEAREKIDQINQCVFEKEM